MSQMTSNNWAVLLSPIAEQKLSNSFALFLNCWHHSPTKVKLINTRELNKVNDTIVQSELVGGI